MCELAVCEMIHPKIHGNEEYIGHYMVSWFISLDDFAKTEEYQTTLQLIQYLAEEMICQLNPSFEAIHL